MTIQSPFRSAAARLLHTLSFPVHRLGYKHLTSALARFAENDRQSLTKEIYPAVGREFGCTGGAVEHAIRMVIVDAWCCRDCRVWDGYFPNRTTAPSNKVFLAVLAEYLQENAPPENGRGWE